MVNKPRLWKYKTGAKAGRLRPAAKQYLSFKLKQYYSQKNLPKRQVQTKLPREERPKRIRNQYVLYTRYQISIRAIKIGDATINELKLAIESYLNSNPQLKQVTIVSTGYEKEAIDDYEDSKLTTGIIYIQTEIRGRTTLEKWLGQEE